MTSDKVSDTPRTDRVARGRSEIASPTVVDVEFARGLERELSDLRHDIARYVERDAQQQTELAALRAAQGEPTREQIDAGWSADLGYENELADDGYTHANRRERVRRILRAGRLAAPPDSAAQGEPVATNKRERLLRKAEEYRDRALHLEHLEAVALRYRDLWLICHESNPRPAEEGELARLGHLRGLLFAAAARRALATNGADPHEL